MTELEKLGKEIKSLRTKTMILHEVGTVFNAAFAVYWLIDKSFVWAGIHVGILLFGSIQHVKYEINRYTMLEGRNEAFARIVADLFRQIRVEPSKIPVEPLN